MIAEVAIQIPDKIYFKSKTTVRGKEGHYILINGSIHQENVTNINIYATGIRVQIHEANIERTEGRKRQLCNNSRRLNTLL